MATNFDFTRSSLIVEQYQREMELIDAALQDESQEEYEERLKLVSCSWSLSCACFHGELGASEVPASSSTASVAYARS
jgi:hypothetical protein